MEIAVGHPGEPEPMPHRRWKYDYAISCARPERALAEEIRTRLGSLGVRVFYDRDLEHEMIGEDGAKYLHDVFGKQARFCIVLVSRESESRRWPQQERDYIRQREADGEAGCLIPVLTDDTMPAWLHQDRLYFDLRERGLDSLIAVLHKKADVFRTTGFVDPQLGTLMAAAVGKRPDDLLDADVGAVSSLSARQVQYDISELAGIERCVGLEVLQLRCMHLWDLSPLRMLTGLRVLELGALPSECYGTSGGVARGAGAIQELRYIEGLEGLSQLALVFQSITDVTPLARLAKIERLDLSYNRIERIYDASWVPSVRSLSLQMNRLSDVAFLSRAAALEMLFIYGNRSMDLSPIGSAWEAGGLRPGSVIVLDPETCSLPRNSDMIAHLRAHDVRIEFPNPQDLWYSSW